MGAAGSKLRDGVREAYTAAAERPADSHPFPVGREFALSLGYPEDLLDSLPPSSVDAFSVVSNISMIAETTEAATVLDLGCGAGLDSLIASQKIGINGRVIGIDFSQPMLARARRAAKEAELPNVEFRLAEAEAIPLADATADVALVNGIFNLNPARDAIFRELARVVKSGGTVYAAELVLKEPLPASGESRDADWFG
ncbi:MAG: methyltransferase domain-containing protein [Candidatus Acidiferrales bacterium]